MAMHDPDDVERLQTRLSRLIERCDLADRQREVVIDAIDELTVVVDELQTRNTELAANGADIERERERYRQLFDTIPDGYVVTDSMGIVLELNTTAAHLLGQPRQRILGHALGSLVDSADRRAFDTQLTRLRQEGPGGKLTINLQVNNDVSVPANLRALVTGNASGDDASIRWLIHDRRTEIDTEELGKSEDRLRNLFLAAPVGMLLLDLDGHIVFANEAADRLLDRESNRISPGESLAALLGDDREGVRLALAEVRGVGRRRTLRHHLGGRATPRVVEHDLSPYRDPGGILQGTLSMLTDVTAAHEAAIDLERSRDFTDAILETIGALVVVLTPAGVVERFNTACERLTGFAPNDVIGRSAFEVLIPPEQRATVGGVLAQLADRGGPNRAENDWLTADGGRRTISWTNTVLTDDDGTPLVIIGTGIDVTETRRLQATLGQTERLQSLGRLAAGVAHDFNNTLSTLQLRLERLARRNRDDSSRADLAAATDTIEHTKHIIADLLSFGRQQSLARETLALNTEIERIGALLTELLGDGIEIHLDLTSQPTVTSIDPARFEHILTNLVLNARDAMPDGGTITITTMLDALPDHDAAIDRPNTNGAEPGFIRVDVADTGIGIGVDDLANIFDPYFTTKPPARGTGLGLATTYGAVTQHGGSITVSSELGIGSIFSLWLPALHGDPSKGGEGPVRPRALIVEDEPGMLEMLDDEISRLGYDTIVAGSAEAALRDHDVAIDLLVTDVQLPGLDGAELAARLQATRPALGVLFVSGAPLATLVSTLPDGAARLAKPFTLDELAAAIAEVTATAEGSTTPAGSRPRDLRP